MNTIITNIDAWQLNPFSLKTEERNTAIMSLIL